MRSLNQQEIEGFGSFVVIFLLAAWNWRRSTGRRLIDHRHLPAPSATIEIKRLPPGDPSPPTARRIRAYAGRKLT